jgi:hypothetical protein
VLFPLLASRSFLSPADFSWIRQGGIGRNSRNVVHDRVCTKLFALNNLKLGDSFQYAGLVMIAGLANTGILDRISHGIHPFILHNFRSFTVAKDMPKSGQQENKYFTHYFQYIAIIMKSIIAYSHPEANPPWSILFTTPKTFYTIFSDSHHILEIIFEIKTEVAKHLRL